jgi:hypothetical protein
MKTPPPKLHTAEMLENIKWWATAAALAVTFTGIAGVTAGYLSALIQKALQ